MMEVSFEQIKCKYHTICTNYLIYGMQLVNRPIVDNNKLSYSFLWLMYMINVCMRQREHNWMWVGKSV